MFVQSVLILLLVATSAYDLVNAVRTEIVDLIVREIVSLIFEGGDVMISAASLPLLVTFARFFSKKVPNCLDLVNMTNISLPSSLCHVLLKYSRLCGFLF